MGVWVRGRNWRMFFATHPQTYTTGVEQAIQSSFVSTCVVVATNTAGHNLALEPLSISCSKASLNNRIPDSLAHISWV